MRRICVLKIRRLPALAGSLLLACTGIATAGPLGPTSPFHPYISEGIEEVFSGHFDRALEISDRMVALDNESPVGHFYRGATYWWMFLINPDDKSIGQRAEENLERAIEKGRKRLEADPDDPETLFYLGGAYGFRARYRIVETQWWGAAWDGKRAKEILERVMILAPDWIDTNLGLGMYNYYVDVLPDYFQLLRIVAFIPAGDREKGLRQLRLAMEQGLYTRPEAQFFLLDIMKDHEKDYPEALELTRDLARKYPENPFFRLLEAMIYVNRMGRYRDAIRVLDDLLVRLESSSFMFADDVALRARYYRAKTDFFRGDTAQARAGFEALAADRPRGPEWVLAWTHLRLGQIHDMEGRRDEAVAEYRRVLEMKESGETHNAAKKWLKEPFRGW